jgi:hypothetical protein
VKSKGLLCLLCAGEPEKAKQLLSVVSKSWNTVKFDTEYELVIYVFQGIWWPTLEHKDT